MKYLTLSRRLALELLSGLIGATGAWALVPDAALGAGGGCQMPGQVTDLFRKPFSVQAVAREYLQIHPSENHAVRLTELLSQDLPRAETQLSQTSDDFRTAVRCRIREDFQTNNVVRLHGWVLSRTEARLCALAALLIASRTLPPGTSTVGHS